jgi:hypothetical protein
LPLLLCCLLTPCLKPTGHQPSTNRTLAIAISEAVDSPSLLLVVAPAHLILHDDSCRVILHVTLATVGAHSRRHGNQAPCWAACACCLLHTNGQGVIMRTRLRCRRFSRSSASFWKTLPSMTERAPSLLSSPLSSFNSSLQSIVALGIRMCLQGQSDAMCTVCCRWPVKSSHLSTWACSAWMC